MAHYILDNPEKIKRYCIFYGKEKEKVKLNRGRLDADLGGVADRILQRARGIVKDKLEEKALLKEGVSLNG